MLAIILSACMASNPGVCKDYKISLDPSIDPASCMVNAPPYFAEWAESHPGWTITKWRCRTAAEDDI